MFVDLLVTTYRRPADIGRLLLNLDQQTHREFRVQIFDGSPDDQVSGVVERYLVGRKGDGYPVVYQRTPAGMTRQRNLAVDHTEGDVSIFLDDDVELDPDYLLEVVKVFREDSAGEIAGLNGYDLNASPRLGAKKRLYRVMGLLPRIGCARYLPWGHPTVMQEGPVFTGIRDRDLLMGHNMAWRTNILRQLRFDPFFVEYPTYVLYDDTDISLRARQHYRLVQSGDARLRHHTSPDGRPPGFHYGFQTVFNAYRNFRIHRPNPGAANLVRFWVWEVLGATLLGLRALREPDHWPVVRGMIAGTVACARRLPGFLAWERGRMVHAEAR